MAIKEIIEEGKEVIGKGAKALENAADVVANKAEEVIEKNVAPAIETVAETVQPVVEKVEEKAAPIIEKIEEKIKMPEPKLEEEPKATLKQIGPVIGEKPYIGTIKIASENIAEKSMPQIAIEEGLATPKQASYLSSELSYKPGQIKTMEDIRKHAEKSPTPQHIELADALQAGHPLTGELMRKILIIPESTTEAKPELAVEEVQYQKAKEIAKEGEQQTATTLKRIGGKIVTEQKPLSVTTNAPPLAPRETKPIETTMPMTEKERKAQNDYLASLKPNQEVKEAIKNIEAGKQGPQVSQEQLYKMAAQEITERERNALKEAAKTAVTTATAKKIEAETKKIEKETQTLTQPPEVKELINRKQKAEAETQAEAAEYKKEIETAEPLGLETIKERLTPGILLPAYKSEAREEVRKEQAEAKAATKAANLTAEKAEFERQRAKEALEASRVSTANLKTYGAAKKLEQYRNTISSVLNASNQPTNTRNFLYSPQIATQQSAYLPQQPNYLNPNQAELNTAALLNGIGGGAVSVPEPLPPVITQSIPEPVQEAAPIVKEAPSQLQPQPMIIRPESTVKRYKLTPSKALEKVIDQEIKHELHKEEKPRKRKRYDEFGHIKKGRPRKRGRPQKKVAEKLKG